METCPVCLSESIKRPKFILRSYLQCSNCSADLALTYATPKVAIAIYGTSIALPVILTALGINLFFVILIMLIIWYPMTQSPKIYKYAHTEKINQSILEAQKYETQIRKDNLREWLPFTLVVIAIVIALILPIIFNI
jgi:L-lactate permease